MLSIESEADVREYLFSLLDPDEENVKHLVQQICLNWPMAGRSKRPKNDKINETVGSGGFVNKLTRRALNAGSILCWGHLTFPHLLESQKYKILFGLRQSRFLSLATIVET